MKQEHEFRIVLKYEEKNWGGWVSIYHAQKKFKILIIQNVVHQYRRMTCVPDCEYICHLRLMTGMLFYTHF